MTHRKVGFTTTCLHGGHRKETLYGAHATPIYQTSTFIFDNTAQGGKRFAGEEPGHIYTRLGNPTTGMLEDKLAMLEGGEAACVMSSGMGAISSVMWTLCKAGAHVIADEVLYGCTHALLSHGMERYGVEVSFVNTSDLEAVKAALKPNTAVVYLETPANPTLKICDLEAVASLVHGYNKDIKVVVDNTFATPYLQRPLSLGCDVVVHSMTKYLNGHGDVVAGCAISSAEIIREVKSFGLKDMTGATVGPFEAFLMIRGLKTLTIRMDRHCDNAEKVAEFLKNHPKVEKVYYPGFPDAQGHEIAKRQMKRFGGMIAFEVAGGREAGAKVLNNLEVCTLAVSLGDTDTLIEHPASMTHSTYSPEELKAAGVPEGLIRLSVGIEDVEDIIADLDHALSLI